MRTTLNISITPELHRFIDNKVRSGLYTSVSEVVREGLRLLERQEQERKSALDEVRRKIAVGLEQLDRGEVVDGEQVFRELAKRSQKARKNASYKRNRAA